MSTLDIAKAKFVSLVEEAGLHQQEVYIRAACLTPKEAIGCPTRKDYPIIKGKERMVEGLFLGAKGQAFTDTPVMYDGTLADILSMPLEDNGRRAIFLATLNAVLNHLGLCRGTVHCKDDEPEHCADEIAAHLMQTYDGASIGLVGFNPAIAESLAGAFGKDRIAITDLFDGNIGGERFGVEIMDGARQIDALVDVSDVLLITGTTLTNGTFDSIREIAKRRNRPFLLFGVTGAGVAALTGIDRLCPCSRRC